MWRKNTALLAYLVHSRHGSRPREDLLELLWGDRPEAAARHSLNESLRVIRRAAGDDAVISDGDMVRLARGAVRADTLDFLSHTEAADWERAATRVAGIFLEGFTVPGASRFEDWLAAERVEWRRRSVEALVNWGRQLESSGDLSAARESVSRALLLDPLSALAVRGLMRVFALAGDRSAALETFAHFETRLRSELRLAPDPETQRLADRVRRQRRWILLPAASSANAGKTSRGVPLVGRERELGVLLGGWRECLNEGLARLLWIEADAGMGKTRLGEELVDRAQLDGAAVGVIRAVESDRAQPWSGVLTLARGGLLEAPGLVAAPPGSLAAFASRLPEWAERFADETEGAAPEPLGRSLSELARAITQEQPLLLQVDDAQWLDHESLVALVAMLRDLDRVSFSLLFLTCSIPVRDELEALRARLGRDVDGTAVHLGALSLSDIATLVRRAMPDYNAEQVDRLARRIERDSAGVPMFATALLHAVTLGLELHGEGEPWPRPAHTMEDTFPAQLPDALVAAIRIGFRRLGKPAQEILATASVLGDRVAFEELIAASGLEADVLAQALDELEWNRWLVAEPRGYAFLSRIVKQVIERDMVTPGRRSRIQRAYRSTPL